MAPVLRRPYLAVLYPRNSRFPAGAVGDSTDAEDVLRKGFSPVQYFVASSHLGTLP